MAVSLSLWRGKGPIAGFVSGTGSSLASNGKRDENVYREMPRGFEEMKEILGRMFLVTFGIFLMINLLTVFAGCEEQGHPNLKTKHF